MTEEKPITITHPSFDDRDLGVPCIIDDNINTLTFFSVLHDRDMNWVEWVQKHTRDVAKIREAINKATARPKCSGNLVKANAIYDAALKRVKMLLLKELELEDE